MQIFLPLILITVLLNILTAPDNLHAAVTGQTIQPDNFCINQISEIPVQKAILKDSSAAFTHVNHYLIDLKEKETWIRETAIKLNQLSGPAEEQYIEKQVTDMEGYYQAGYRLQGSGYIRFDNGEWIYLISNSAHDNEKVGDITLAMDNKRRFYINEGHVCGGIIHFTTQQVIKKLSSDEFFRHFVSDQENADWITFVYN
jgi:hypothetical protein